MKPLRILGKQSELLSELEQEQPRLPCLLQLHLTFVPIGLLEKSEFFNIGNEMDPAQLGVMYKTWQHNFKYGIQKFMTKTASGNGVCKE